MSTTDTNKQPPPLAFIDCETTGLDPEMHEIWEIAVIKRDADGRDWESHYQIRPTELHLARVADEKALEIGRYYERMVVPADCSYVQIDGDGRPRMMSRQTLVDHLTRLLDGAVLVGSNPSFDAAFLRYFLDAAPWHYRTVDVATLAVGALYGRAREWTRKDCDATWYSKVASAVGWPWKSYEASRHVEVEPPAKDVAHTALGDARWARDVWDAVTIPDAFYTASDEQLARMAGEALSRTHGGQQ